MGPNWVLLAPDGPHVGPMNLAIRDACLMLVKQPWGVCLSESYGSVTNYNITKPRQNKIKHCACFTGYNSLISLSNTVVQSHTLVNAKSTMVGQVIALDYRKEKSKALKPSFVVSYLNINIWPRCNVLYVRSWKLAFRLCFGCFFVGLIWCIFVILSSAPRDKYDYSNPITHELGYAFQGPCYYFELTLSSFLC